MYDILIVGAGPAGITAAIYAARKKMNSIVLSKDIGGQSIWAGDVANYTGFQFIPGVDLAKKFEEHLKSFKVELVEGVEVSGIENHKDHFVVKADGKEYLSRTVVIATGRKPRLLGVPGEKEFKNKGVTYCATCDGPLFAGKDVAIIGGGNSALDATLQLIPIARKIYLVNNMPELKADPIMIEKAKKASNVEIINDAKSKRISGEKFVTSLLIEVASVERLIEVKGIFIEIGSIPVKTVAESDNILLNGNNEIIVNARCETDVPGIFAAGDVTDVPEKQIIVASGQGCIAALSAFKYLSKMKFD